MATIMLTGANGNVSSATIRALQGSGHKLVGLVRDPAKGQALAAQGVELRTGDLDRLRTVEDAFTGVDVAFVLAPPGNLAPVQCSNALWAARRGGVKHVVRLSAVGAAHDAPTINSRLHALSDSELERSGLAYTIVKPHFFLQNLMMAAGTVAQQGAIYFALGDAKLPMIDVADVGASVAAILKDPAPHAGKTYTLTGPTAIGMHEVAGALGEALGKAVHYVAVPVPAMIEQLAKYGVDDFGQTSLRDYFTAYSAGWNADVTSTVEALTGAPAHDVRHFARAFASAAGGAADGKH
ncbi:MAG TPA: NAD(P)H-binding protein [Kofleriaceae bacterium]|nr:NAD(P)H-binding protein [Kofleriaceae bacterium]